MVGWLDDGERLWVDRFGNLRNTVRQSLVNRQLAAHVRPGCTLLDVGCGQGTQLVRVAMRGCRATGIDPSPALLSRAQAEAQRCGVTVELHEGALDDLQQLLGARQFDVVCAHGLLMYLEDTDAAIRALTARVADGGLVSLTFRNGDALAFRPGARGDWDDALHAFDADGYVNELGLSARAHRRAELTSRLGRLGYDVEAWYGVRVFTDPADPDEPVPAHGLDALLEAEWLAGCRDPYRAIGAQIHLVARRR